MSIRREAWRATPCFRCLKFDAQEQQRLQLSTYIAEVDRRWTMETDLQRKVGIITEAELTVSRASRISANARRGVTARASSTWPHRRQGASYHEDTRAV